MLSIQFDKDNQKMMDFIESLDLKKNVYISSSFVGIEEFITVVITYVTSEVIAILIRKVLEDKGTIVKEKGVQIDLSKMSNNEIDKFIINITNNYYQKSEDKNEE